MGKRTHIDRLFERKGITKKQYTILKAQETAYRQKHENAALAMTNEAITKAKLEQNCHDELLAIHKIVMCIAECPPRADQDTYTVGAVKDMAQRINQELVPKSPSMVRNAG